MTATEQTTSQPAAAPMTREDMTGWLRMRGVNDGPWMDRTLAQYEGKTEDEMDAICDAICGPIA